MGENTIMFALAFFLVYTGLGWLLTDPTIPHWLSGGMAVWGLWLFYRLWERDD